MSAIKTRHVRAGTYVEAWSMPAPLMRTAAQIEADLERARKDFRAATTRQERDAIDALRAELRAELRQARRPAQFAPAVRWSGWFKLWLIVMALSLVAAAVAYRLSA